MFQRWREGEERRAIRRRDEKQAEKKKTVGGRSGSRSLTNSPSKV
jgi:hypothetical protein